MFVCEDCGMNMNIPEEETWGWMQLYTCEGCGTDYRLYPSTTRVDGRIERDWVGNAVTVEAELISGQKVIASAVGKPGHAKTTVKVIDKE